MLTARLVFACLIVLMSWPAAMAGDSFPFCRAAYNYRSLADLNGSGFDGVFCPADWNAGGERVLKNLGQRSLEVATLNITFVAGLYYCVPPAGDIGNYSRAVGKDRPAESIVPSPVDETWWRHYVEEPGVAVANLSLYYPVWGLVWDWERYIEGRNFEREEYSYDEAAVQAFAGATNRAIPYVPPTERYSWLVSRGLVEEFHRWQEERLYSMAKETEKKIHAINPNLSLGLLGFTNDWFPWTVLGAFNSSTAPVTAWCEETYAGYYMVETWASPQYFRELWRQHRLNGQFLPALWGMTDPWSLLTEMEAAIRDNGALWVYLWDLGIASYRFETYKKMYRIFDSFLFFNASVANPLPAFDLCPGIQAKPYLGPGGTVSVLLDPYVHVVPSSITILSDVCLWYAGEDLSIKLLESNPTLGPEDMPCIVSGLEEDDLLPTQVWAMLEELGNLTQFYRGIGAGQLSDVESIISLALDDFRAGRYLQARSRILGVRDDVYQKVLRDIWPTVEEGFASPRSSKVPIPVLRSISDARDMFEGGKMSEGETYLFEGLREWSAAVPEPMAMLSFLIGALLRYRHGSFRAS